MGLYLFRKPIGEFIKGLAKDAGAGAAQSVMPSISLPSIDLSGLLSGLTFQPGFNIGTPYSPQSGIGGVASQQVPAPYQPGGSGTRIDPFAPVVPMTQAQVQRAAQNARLNPQLGGIQGWPTISGNGITMAGFRGLGVKTNFGAVPSGLRNAIAISPAQLYGQLGIEKAMEQAAALARASKRISAMKNTEAQANASMFKNLVAQSRRETPIKNPVPGSSDRYTTTRRTQYGETITHVSIPTQQPASAYAASGGRTLWGGQA